MTKKVRSYYHFPCDCTELLKKGNKTDILNVRMSSNLAVYLAVGFFQIIYYTCPTFDRQLHKILPLLTVYLLIHSNI